METSLHIVWKVIPGYFQRAAAESEDGLDVLNRWAFLYTIGASVSMAAAAGASIKYLGFPGDLPNVIKCVHQKGYVPMRQTLPMVSVVKRRGAGKRRLIVKTKFVGLLRSREGMCDVLFSRGIGVAVGAEPPPPSRSTRSAAALQALQPVARWGRKLPWLPCRLQSQDTFPGTTTSTTSSWSGSAPLSACRRDSAPSSAYSSAVSG